jgi:hypothetical protein
VGKLRKNGINHCAVTISNVTKLIPNLHVQRAIHYLKNVMEIGLKLQKTGK